MKQHKHRNPSLCIGNPSLHSVRDCRGRCHHHPVIQQLVHVAGGEVRLWSTFSVVNIPREQDSPCWEVAYNYSICIGWSFTYDSFLSLTFINYVFQHWVQKESAGRRTWATNCHKKTWYRRIVNPEATQSHCHPFSTRFLEYWMETGYPVGWFMTDKQLVSTAFLRFKVVPCLPRRIMKQLWIALIQGFSEHPIASMRIYASNLCISMQSRQINIKPYTAASHTSWWRPWRPTRVGLLSQLARKPVGPHLVSSLPLYLHRTRCGGCTPGPLRGSQPLAWDLKRHGMTWLWDGFSHGHTNHWCSFKMFMAVFSLGRWL